MKTLLITSVGSLVSHNVLDCLDRLDRPYRRIGINSIADAPGNFRCDHAYLAPPAADDGAYRARLAEIIDAHQPDLIIPGRDDDVPVLAELRQQRGGDPRFLCGAVAPARIFANKLESARFAARHGLPFVETAETPDEARRLAATFGYPLIAKPADGAGSKNVYAVTGPDGLEAAITAGLLIQRFLSPPPEIAAPPDFAIGVPLAYALPVTNQIAGQAVIGPDGKVVGCFATSYDLASGYALRVRRLDNPAFDGLLRRYAEAAAAEGHIGLFNMQCQSAPDGAQRQSAPDGAQRQSAPDGAILPFELGARFTGSTSARARLGWNEVDIVLRRFVHGEAAAPPPGGETAAPPIVFKTLGEFDVAAADLASLTATGYWRRGA